MSEEQRLPYPKLAPEGIGALRDVEHYLNALSGLERPLLELVRLRVSQINGCSFCLGMHGQELVKLHEPESRIQALAGWRESPEAFTKRECAALRWAEVITNIQDGHAEDAEFAAVRDHFTDKETVDLTLAISIINAWNRLALAFRPQWRTGKGGPAASDDSGDQTIDSGADRAAGA